MLKCEVHALSRRFLLPNAQDLRRAAGWRAGCSVAAVASAKVAAGGMTAKAVRSGHWLGAVFGFLSIDVRLGDYDWWANPSSGIFALVIDPIKH